MYEDLKGKVALITGAGKRTGIGFAIAKKFAANGADIIIADLGYKGHEDDLVKTATDSEMNEIVREMEMAFNIKAVPVQVDVTDNESITRMVDTVKSSFKRIHILCNNAGASFGVPNTFFNYDESSWMKTIDVNLHSVFKVSRAILPLMIEKGGSIINTASRAGKTPPLFNGAYGVAKAGVIMLTKIMALELAGNNIRVNAICPGQIMTDLEKWRFGLEAELFDSTVEEREAEMCKSIPLSRIGKPDEVGDLAAFLGSDASAYMTGQAVNITGGQLMEF